MEDFSSAISIDPKNAIAFNNRGLAYRKLNRTEAAIKDYTFAIQLNPIYALAFSNRGFVFELNGKKEQAVKDYRSAIFLDPSLSAAKAGLKRLGVNTAITKEVDELVTSGKALAEKNCAWCHAIGRQINSPNKMAPPFRYMYKRYPVLDLRKPLTRSIDHPPNAMPKFRLSDWDMDTIIAYINSLSVPN